MYTVILLAAHLLDVQKLRKSLGIQFSVSKPVALGT